MATKLTVGVEGNRNALKFAARAREASSRLRAGKINSLTGQPVESIKFNSSPLSVLEEKFDQPKYFSQTQFV